MITLKEFYNSLTDEEKTNLKIVELLTIYGEEEFINLLFDLMDNEGKEIINKLEKENK